MGVWTRRVEEEGLGDIAGRFWVEGLNLFEALVSSRIERLSARLGIGVVRYRRVLVPEVRVNADDPQIGLGFYASIQVQNLCL